MDPMLQRQQGTVWSSDTHTDQGLIKIKMVEVSHPKYKYKKLLRLCLWNDLSYHNQATSKTNAVFDLKREFTCCHPINLIQQEYLLCLTKQTYKRKSSNMCA